MKEIEEFLGKRFENKKTVLLGAGVSNTPLVEFLTSFGARVEVRDKKSEVELGELAEKNEKPRSNACYRRGIP